MKFLQSVLNALSATWRWLRHSPRAPAVVWLWVIGMMLLCIKTNYHEALMPRTTGNVTELPVNWQAPPLWTYMFLYVMAYARLFILLGGVAYNVYIIRAFPDAEKMLRPTWIASLTLTIWALATTFYDRWEQGRVGVIGEEISNWAFVIQMILMIGLLLSPPFIISYYLRSRLLERYVIRSFLQPLIFCFVAFCTLWIVMDLLNNLQDFHQNNIGGGEIALFYIKLIPFIYVTVAPVTLLLATLYSLGRMSRSNELISMLSAGRSLGQVLRPIYFAGIYASFLGMVANYHWAPASEGNKRKLLEDVKDRVKGDVLMTGLVYRNNEDRRTWFIGVVPNDLRRDSMRRIEVRQEDGNGKLTKAWFAKSANWVPEDKTWQFFTGAEVDYKNGSVTGSHAFRFENTDKSRVDQAGWSETPWILMSGSLDPDFLDVPQLISFMTANHAYGDVKLAPFRTYLNYRFALPWQSIVVVLIAAPLGVVFSRRGMLGGVAGSIFIFFFLLFIDHLFLNMGKGRHMPAWLAVWMPHLILGTMGLYLFRLRSQNRDFPKLGLKSLADAVASVWRLLVERLGRRPVA